MVAKKEKYIEIVGITGMGEDYNVYKLNIKERIIGYLIGFVGGFLATEIMFGVVIASVIIGAIVGFIAIPIYNRYLFKKRKKTIRMQFRDLLDSLNNSFSAGKNTNSAFGDAYDDMCRAYSKDAIIAQEVFIINKGLVNNFTIEQLLENFAQRTGINDIDSFAQTFSVCTRLGGNLKKVVADTRDIINDKIEIEMEIETTVSSNKNEINILCFMPFVVITMIKGMGNDAITANTPINVIIKLVAIGIFVLAYFLGQKITDIKV